MDSTTLQAEQHPSGLKIIHIVGDLDSVGTHEVQDAFSSVVGERGDKVIVDLRQVNFISSAGMAMLLVKGKRLKQGGGLLALAAAPARVEEALELAGFDELFKMYDSLEAALANLAG